MRAFGQRFDCDSPALRAGLGSASWIDGNRLTASVRSFVGDEGDELSPRGVVNFFGKHPARETFDIEVFERDASKLVDQLPAFFVQEVATGIADVGLKLRNGSAALAAHLRTALGARQRTLQTAQLASVPLRDALALDCRAITQRGETGQTKIDANAFGAGTFNGGNFEVQHKVPLASIPREDRGLRLAWPCAVPADFNLARNADDLELAGLAQAHAVAEDKIGSVVTVASFETRETRRVATLAASEEGLERLVELAHDLLFCGAGPAANVRKVATDRRQACDLFMRADAGALAIGKNAVLKTCVVKLTKVRKHFGRKRGLHPVGLDAEFVAQHGHRSDAFLVLDVFANGRFGNVPNGACKVRARPQRRQARTQVRELLTQKPGRRPLKAVYDLGRRARGISLNEQVNVVWHHFCLVNQEAVFGGNFREQLLKAHINGRHKNGAAVLRAPHKVILQRVHRTGISGIAFAFHAALDTRRKTNCQHKRKERAALPPLAEASGPRAAETYGFVLGFCFVRAIIWAFL